MPVNTKAIRRRIKSVGNTKKITKAMEMVSAAKMRRAVDATLRTRPYATLARQLMEQLSQVEKQKIPLLEVRPVQKILLILVTSNRGLCGSFNTNLFKKMALVLRNPANIARHRVPGKEDILPANGSISIDILGVGKRSASFAKQQGFELVGVFDGLNERPTFEDVLPMSQMAMSGYVNGTYDKVIVGYTDYRSSLVQEPKVRQVLPISEIDLEKMAGELEQVGVRLGKTSEKRTRTPIEEYVFEPNATHILKNILPRLVEAQIYQAVLESAASEYSARMVAMKNASEAAGDMIKELNLTYNKARQAAITQEIAEIVGGAAALE